LSTAYHLKLT